jgi:hypothetical protein
MEVLRQHRNYFFILLFLSLSFAMYWGCLGNYFFMDDFHWLARGIIVHSSPGEMFTIEGRDFNPVFIVLLGILIKIFGISTVVLRSVSILVFSAVLWLLYRLLKQHLELPDMIALPAALLPAVNIFLSEVVLNLSALVYSLAFLFFLSSANALLQKKHWRFVFLAAAALLTKETVLLGLVPLLFLAKDKIDRRFILAALAGLGGIRALLQLALAGSSGSYTGFVDTGNFIYKLYFTLMRSMNLSPYSFSLETGFAVVLLILLLALYLGKKDQRMWFFASLFLVFSVFFSLLPKISSRYIFFPSIAFWGMLAILFTLLRHRFSGSPPITRILGFTLPVLLILLLLLNVVPIQKEIEDYRILGRFSKDFITEIGDEIKQVSTRSSIPPTLSFSKTDFRRLQAVYRRIIDRKNLPKLLPFRQHSIKGVIEPRHLVPIIFYPENYARWKTVKETPQFISGTIFLATKEHEGTRREKGL